MSITTSITSIITIITNNTIIELLPHHSISVFFLLSPDLNVFINILQHVK